MVSDREVARTEDDKLGFAPYAEAIAALIDNPDTSTPLTVSINAPWGTGKSSLGRMIDSRLRSKPAAGGTRPHSTTWFDAWLNDEADHLPGALVAHIAQAANNKRSRWRRIVRPLSRQLCSPAQRTRRRIWSAVMLLMWASILAAGLFLLLPEVLPHPEFIKAMTAKYGEKPAGFTVIAIGIALLLRELNRTGGAISNWLRNPHGEADSASLIRVRDEFHRLISAATPRGSRFVVFIDNIERCRPPRPVDILEILNQMLTCEGVVVVILGDMTAISACVEVRYSDIASRLQGEESSPLSFGRNYLQKIVQVQFDMPRISAEDAITFAESLTKPKQRDPPPISISTILGEIINETFADFFRLQLKFIASFYDLATMIPRALVRSLQFSIRTAAPRRLRIASTAPLAATFLLGLFLVVFFGFIPKSLPTLVGQSWILVATVGVLMLTLLAAMRFSFDLRLHYGRSKLDAELKSSTSTVSEDRPEPGFSQREWKELVRERKVLQLSNDSPFVRDAVGHAIRLLPVSPRATKRILNHVRLFTVVANQTGLLASNSSLSPQVIGKWVAFQEGWPAVAELVHEKPAVMTELENAPQATLTSHIGKAVEGSDLMDLTIFLSASPPLGAYAAVLARLRPVPQLFVVQRSP